MKPLALALLAALALPAAAAERVLRLDPSATRIGFTLAATAHTVEGSFALRDGVVRFDPATGAASGEIVVDLASGRTGNTRRDRTMHETVLETPRFPRAIFRPRRLSGTVASAGPSTVTLEGILELHGAEHPLALPATVTAREGRLAVASAFDVPYVAWGLRDPSVLLLRVAKTVRVTVRTEGRLE